MLNIKNITAGLFIFLLGSGLQAAKKAYVIKRDGSKI
jgi:hypothetical protein